LSGPMTVARPRESTHDSWGSRSREAAATRAYTRSPDLCTKHDVRNFQPRLQAGRLQRKRGVVSRLHGERGGQRRRARGGRRKRKER